MSKQLKYRLGLIILFTTISISSQSIKGTYSEKIAFRTIWLSDAIYEVEK
jgi:hypothetical protein